MIKKMEKELLEAIRMAWEEENPIMEVYYKGLAGGIERCLELFNIITDRDKRKKEVTFVALDEELRPGKKEVYKLTAERREIK